MSTVVNKIGGIIRNAFDPRKMEEWQEYFQRWTMTGDDRLNCYGIDEKNHEAEQWFQKNIFSTVKQCLGDDKMRSIFGMYTESVKPYVIHSDEYHVAKTTKLENLLKVGLFLTRSTGTEQIFLRQAL